MPHRFGPMSLRRNFDSFTAEHKLRDAQEEFTQAMHRFRKAEEANAPNLIALKRQMEFLERKVEYSRHCVYTGQPAELDLLDYSYPSL